MIKLWQRFVYWWKNGRNIILFSKVNIKGKAKITNIFVINSTIDVDTDEK